MYNNLKIVILLILLIICDAAKILTIIPFPMKSHDIVYKPLIMELVRQGHNVTAIGPYPTPKYLIDENMEKNYHEIVYESNYKDHFKMLDYFEIKNHQGLLGPEWLELFPFWDVMYHLSEDIYKNPHVQKIIKNSMNERFDLVICEGFFAFESTFAFGELFQSPVIAVATFGTTIYMNQHIGNPIGSAYYPMFLLPYTDKMNFFQRLHNFLTNSYVQLCTHMYHLPAQEILIRKYFQHALTPRKMPKLKDLLAEVSLVFLNTHAVLGMPRPNLPNLVEIGGLHIQQQTNNSRDKSLQNLLDNASQGVIYFSLGSNVNMTKMPKNYVEAFMKAFSSIPQLVLWKLDGTTLTGQTKNILIKEWFPQQQILAHNHCLAFITHGGMLSLQEAVYNGVPVIGIPFFGDQTMNMKRVSEINFGIYMDYENISYESLTWSLNQIINNKKYKETANRLSTIFQDNSEGTPLKKAVYWVEYILRYNGAPHLRTTARYLPWYKYLLLDVIIVLLLIFVILFYIIYKLLKLFINYLILYRDTKKKID